MQTIAIDTETFLIAPGRAAPPMVCTTWATKQGSGILHADDPACFKLWRRSLRRKRIVGARIAYDMAVALAKWRGRIAADIFEAYKAGRVRDVQINQRLLDIEDGCLDGRWDATKGKRIRYRYSLAALTSRLLIKFRAKDADTWRRRYGELIDILDTDLWPADATRYAIEDAEDCLPILDIQEHGCELVDAGKQAYADFALYLMTCRGIRTERKACKRLIRLTHKLLARAKKRCERVGLINKDTGKKSIKVARERMIAYLGGPEAQAEIKELAAEKFAKQHDNHERALARIAFDHNMTDREMDLARLRLGRMLSHDWSKSKFLRRWEAKGYTEDLYRDLRSKLEVAERAFTVTMANGHKVRLTKKGTIKVDAEACAESHDKYLTAYATLTSASTLIKKATRMLEGARIPLQTSFMSLVETGRTSSRAGDAPLVGDNFQNFRRDMRKMGGQKVALKDELPGQRECIVARRGFVFCSIDYNAIEMRAFAQLAYNKLGWSKLRDVLNAGQDPHLALAANSILNISYEDAVKRLAAGDPEVERARQYAKIPNFALLGGGGWRILPDYAKGMDIVLDEVQARALYEAFHDMWTEVAEMHKHFKTFIHRRYTHEYSGRRRYVTKYAQACNNPFQGLAADLAKEALCRLAEAEYVPGGALYGGYSVLFMHDEVIFEFPEDRASEFAWRACQIMLDAANDVYLTDVKATAEPALMRRLNKKAKTLKHATRKDIDGNPLLLVYESA